MMQPDKILKTDESRRIIWYLFEPPDGNLDAFEDKCHGFMERGGGGMGWQAIESFIPDERINYAGEPIEPGSWIAGVKFREPALFDEALEAAGGRRICIRRERRGSRRPERRGYVS